MDEVFVSNSTPFKKKIFIVLFFLVISVIVVYFLVYRYKYTLHLKENIVYEVGDKISYNVSDYITNNMILESDYSLNFKEVPIEDGVLTKVGKYNYKVKYKNVSKTGVLIVKDTIKPIVVTQDLTIGVKEELNLDDFLLTCEDYSKPCEVTYARSKDEVNTSKAGKYTFDILISDQFGNKEKKSVNLEVKNNYSYENFKKSDLTVHHIEPKFDDFKNEFMLKYSEGISEEDLDSDLKYLELQELLSEDFTAFLPSNYIGNRIKESDIITIYNKYNYIIGFAIRVTLDNNTSIYLRR